MNRKESWEEKRLRLDLIPPEAERALAEVLAMGAEKYSERGWELDAERPDLRTHMQSLLRHIHEYKSGLTRDKESGLHPLKHALARTAMMVTLIMRGES